MKVDRLSVVALHIELYFNSQYLGNGTGFTIRKKNSRYLVTNWHVVTGKHPVTKKSVLTSGMLPNKAVVWHHRKGKLGSWDEVEYELYLNKTPKWIQATAPNGDMVDVVLLAIDTLPYIDYHDLDLSLSESELTVSPSEPVSIIGFPYGRSAALKFPIWKTGHIASDFDINFDDKPIFLIDTTTKPGMSGSPVFAKRVGSFQIDDAMIMGTAIKFMGIYSGRTSDDEIIDNSNLGLVWKPVVISILLREK